MKPRLTKIVRMALMLAAAAVGLLVTGCREDVAKEASSSDANGYLCERCGGKFYSQRSVFLSSKCPKCGQSALMEVIAYECPKDHHLTLRGRSDERKTSAVCEQCQGPLGGIRLPREKDLKTWGAIKVTS